jgi:hypothetical protein
MLLSMPELGAAELRAKGTEFVQEVAAEIARLDEMLADYRKTAE